MVNRLVQFLAQKLIIGEKTLRAKQCGQNIVDRALLILISAKF